MTLGIVGIVCVLLLALGGAVISVDKGLETVKELEQIGAWNHVGARYRSEVFKLLSACQALLLRENERIPGDDIMALRLSVSEIRKMHRLFLSIAEQRPDLQEEMNGLAEQATRYIDTIENDLILRLYAHEPVPISVIEDITHTRLESLERKLNSFEDVMMLLVAASIRDAERITQKNVRNSIVLLAVSLCVTVCIIIWLNGSISGPVKKMSSQLMHLAEGEGDLDFRFSETGDRNDEIGLMRRSFNRFIASLAAMVQKLEVSVYEGAELGNAIKQIGIREHEAAENLRTGIERMVVHQGELGTKIRSTLTESKEISLAVQEVNRTLLEHHQQIEQTTFLADTLVKEVLDLAVLSSDEGHKIGGLTGLLEEGRKVQDSFVTVSGRTVEEMERMEDALRTIESIANETDLLAINAAIEAANAGNYGKGFSVLARQIRSLAEAAKESAGKVESELREAGRNLSEIRDIGKENLRIFEMLSNTTSNLIVTFEQMRSRLEKNALNGREVRTSMDRLKALAGSVERSAAAADRNSAVIVNMLVSVAERETEIAMDLQGMEQNAHTVSTHADLLEQESRRNSEIADNLSWMMQRFSSKEETAES